MKNRILVLAILSIISTTHINAQSVVGFWKVTSVTVGKRSMTPVAKWFRNNEDGTFQSGNGWTKNAYGKWSFDKEKNEFVPVNENGVKDEFGSFKVSFAEEGMIWTRDEEGMKVIVNLLPITEMPIAPGDKIKGLWQLAAVKEGDKDIISSFDPKQKQYLLIRTDMKYKLRHSDEHIEKGYWHIDLHKPMFTLMNYNREIENQVFSVEFKKDQLMMKQQKKSERIFIYKRIHTFPE